MKIACITSSQIPSTTANSIQVMKVCQSLVQNGHQVDLWAPGKTTAPLESLVDWYGLSDVFPIHWLPASSHLKRYDLAWRAVQQAGGMGMDLVYTWMLQAASFASLRGLPVLMEMHDRPTGQIGRRLFRWFIKRRGKKRFVFITQALQRFIERDYSWSFPPEERVIAPNGVDLERFSMIPDAPTARRDLNLPERLTAVYSGHFYSGRGMDVLLRLAKAYPQVQFVWVGGKPEAVTVWQQCLAQEGVENVCLPGFVENKRLPLYQAAGEILLMPYEREIAGSSGGNSADICSPMKMFEYMATGRAILTSDLPVIREVLNEKNAVFCPPENVPAWVKAFGSLVEDPYLMDALAKQARQDASRYTWKARAERALASFP